MSIPDTQQAGYDLLAPGGFMVLLLPHVLEPTKGRGFSLIWGVWTLPYTRIELCGKLFRLLKEGVLRVSHNAPYAGSSCRTPSRNRLNYTENVCLYA